MKTFTKIFSSNNTNDALKETEYLLSTNNSISFEGILYDLAFNVLHKYWNKKMSWKFMKSVIINKWGNGKAIGEIQKKYLLENIYSAYIKLRKFRFNDIILDVQRKFTIYNHKKRLDCFLYREGVYIVRDVKSSVHSQIIPCSYKNQLAIYALGVEKYRHFGNNTVNTGEILAINPFRLVTLNLTEKKKEMTKKLMKQEIRSQRGGTKQNDEK